MNICENCGKEHDGSYGSGRFCSKHCRLIYIGKKSIETRKKNGNFISGFAIAKFKYSRSPYGTWKCKHCEFIAQTRRELRLHCNDYHPELKYFGRGTSHGPLSEECKRKISEALTGKTKGIASTPEKEAARKAKISSSMKKNPACGGKRTHAGIGKKGRYKGFWCDSSWELAYVIYNLEHNIEFKRYSNFFEYEYKGNIHRYYPDFELSDGTIVEIKGNTKSEQWAAKKNAIPSNIKFEIIDNLTIQKYLNYVEEKYGKNYISLYEFV